MNDVWVILECHKGVGQIFTYRGQISREDLDAWERGELIGAVKLKSTYWFEEDRSGRAFAAVVGKQSGFRNGTGVLYVKADTVVVIMEMRAPDPGVLDDEPAQVVQLGSRLRSVPFETNEEE